MKNSKKIISIILVISLVMVLSITLFACHEDEEGDKVRDYEMITQSLKDRGFTTSFSIDKVEDTQISSIVPKNNLKWVLKGERNTTNNSNVEDIDVVFVIQYKTNEDAKECEKILNANSVYKVNNKSLNLHTYTTNNYLYFGTDRAVRVCKIVSIEFRELKEDNLYFKGYDSKSVRRTLLGGLQFTDSQITFIDENDLDFYVYGEKVLNGKTELVYIFDFKQSGLLEKVQKEMPNTLTYEKGTETLTLKTLVDGSYLYVGTDIAINDAKTNI